MKNKITFYLILAVILWNFPIQCFAHDESDNHSELFKTVIVKDGTNLNIVECIALAFKNSPKIKRKKYELDIAKSNLGIAKSAFFPVIGTGVGYYHENNSNKQDYDRYYRVLPSVGVTVNQLVWDFGKSTANIKMEEFYKIGAEYEFIDSLCSTLFEVKEKYYELLKAQANVAVAKDNVKICKKYLEIAKNKPDKTTASLYLSKALFELSYAETAEKNAKVSLSNSMFVDNTPNYNIINTDTFNFNNDYNYETQTTPQKFEPKIFNFTRQEAPNIAYSNSPDLKVLESTRNAMEQALKYIKRTYMPDLNANVGYGYNNSNLNSNNSLQVGVSLSANTNLMELKHSIKRADASLGLADNEIELFKKDLYFRIQEAFNNLEFAQGDVLYAQNTAVKALDNINTVEKLYSNGTLDYIALQEARKDYITAIQNYIKSLHFYNRTLIQVEEVLHYHLVDIHHKTQHAMTSHSEELIEHLNEALGCEGKEKRKNRFRKLKENL